MRNSLQERNLLEAIFINITLKIKKNFTKLSLRCINSKENQNN